MIMFGMDPRQIEKIEQCKSEIKKKQGQIFDMLLKVSKSFSDETVTKYQRNDLFSRVDELRKEIKQYNIKVKALENGEEIEEPIAVVPEQAEEVSASTADPVMETIEELTNDLKVCETILEEVEKEEQETIIEPEKRVRASRMAANQLILYEEKTSKIQGLFGKLKSWFRKSS